MAAQPTHAGSEAVHDDRGNLTGYRRTLPNVSLEAVQTTEIHRTLENDHTVTEVELPGLIDLYLVVGNGRVRLDQFKAPVILEAIERGDKAAAAQSQPAESASVAP